MFDSKNSYIDQNTDLQIFNIGGLHINNGLQNTIFLNGKYFFIKYGMQYGHLLMDGIGAFLYLKKIIPELKLAFIKINIESSIVCDDFINYFNAKLIDLNSNNIVVENLYFFYTEDIRISGIQNIDTNNIFRPPIPSQLFLNKYYYISENSDIWKKYTKQWIIALYDEFKKYKDNNINQKIFIDRSNDFSMSTPYSKTDWFAKNRLIDKNIYFEILENIKTNNINIINFNQISFFEQIKISSQSNLYITLNGTSILNAIWCSDETQIIKINHNKNYDNLNYNWDYILECVNKTNILNININDFSKNIAGLVGLEPTTQALTVPCSAN